MIFDTDKYTTEKDYTCLLWVVIKMGEQIIPSDHAFKGLIEGLVKARKKYFKDSRTSRCFGWIRR